MRPSHFKTKSNKSGVPLILALCLLLPKALFAQQPIGNINGQIRVDRGDLPPRQFMVELRMRGAPIVSTYSDTQGNFAFSNLVPNLYQVTINDEAYYPFEKWAAISTENPTAVLQITLRPREDVKKDSISARPAGGNPFLVNPDDYNKRFPKKAVKEYQKGLESEQKGKQDEAISHYLDALKIAPDYYPAHNNLGSLYLTRHDFKSAETEFRNAIRLDQNDSQAYLNLGNLFLLSERYPDAAAELALGLQRRPDSAFGHFLEGSLASRTGHYPEAEQDLHEALRLDPTMWQAHLQLVNIYLQQKRRNEAITELQLFLKDSSGSPAVPNARELLKKLQTQDASEH